MFAWGIGIGLTTPVVDTTDPSYGLRIYLDKTYNTEWNAYNIPDLEALSWQAEPDNDNWYTTELDVYLANTGTGTISVWATATEDPNLAIPGFGVSSSKYILEPNEQRTMTITFEQIYWYSGSPMVYFQIDPNATILDDDNSAVDTWSFIIMAAFLLVVSGWVLHQKNRSYGWLILSLSFIGPIVILALSNKSNVVEQEDKTK